MIATESGDLHESQWARMARAVAIGYECDHEFYAVCRRLKLDPREAFTAPMNFIIMALAHAKGPH